MRFNLTIIKRYNDNGIKSLKLGDPKQHCKNTLCCQIKKSNHFQLLKTIGFLKNYARDIILKSPFGS